MTTMIADPPRKTTMGIGFEANRRLSGDPLAWKQAMGTKPIAARLALLPDSNPRWDRIGLSAAGQFAILGFLLMLPLLFPERMQTALHLRVTELMQPVTEIPVAPPPPPTPKVKAKVAPPEPKPVAPEPVKLNPKQTHVFLAAKVAPPKIKTLDAKPVELNPVFEQVKIDTPTSQPKRPKEDVKVGNLGTGSAAPATVVAPAIATESQVRVIRTKPRTSIVLVRPLCRVGLDTATAPAARKEYAARWRARGSVTARRILRQAPSAACCSPPGSRIRQPPRRRRRKRRAAKAPRRLLTSWRSLVRSTPRKGVL